MCFLAPTWSSLLGLLFWPGLAHAQENPFTQQVEAYFLFEETWFYVLVPVVALLLSVGLGLMLHQRQVEKAADIFPDKLTETQMWMPTIICGLVCFLLVGIGYAALLLEPGPTKDAAISHMNPFVGSLIACMLINVAFFFLTSRGEA